MFNYTLDSTQKMTSGHWCKTDLKIQDLNAKAMWQLSPAQAARKARLPEVSGEFVVYIRQQMSTNRTKLSSQTTVIQL